MLREDIAGHPYPELARLPKSISAFTMGERIAQGIRIGISNVTKIHLGIYYGVKDRAGHPYPELATLPKSISAFTMA